MARTGMAIATITLLSVASAAHAAPWFGDKQGLHRLDPGTGQIDVDIASPTPIALAVDGTNASVWSLTANRLVHYSADGTLLSSAPLSPSASRHGGARVLASNPTNGSVWVAAQNKLSHFDASGTLLGALNLSIEDMEVAQDGTLWVLTQRELRRYSDQGTLLGSTPLWSSDHPQTLLALDATAGRLWIADKRQVTQRDTSDPSHGSVSLTLPDTTHALSLDGQTGTLWLLGQKSLMAYSRAGAPVVSQGLRSLSIELPEAIAFDARLQAVWLGHEHGLSRLSTAGALIATIARSSNVASIALGASAPVNAEPTLALVRPQPGAFVNAQPTFVFQYGANCSGAPCGLPNSAYASYVLTATLDGNPVGSAFTFNPVTGQATFQPFAPLAEGPHELSGQVTDGAGQQSAVVTAQFTVDSVAPQILALSPQSGSVLTASPMTLTGMVDDPQATVRLSNGSIAQGSVFTFPVSLSIGVNTLTLTATDPAGNVRTQVLTYTYDPPNTAPTVALTSPANGSNFTAPANITLTATASDSDGSIARVEFLSNGALVGSDTTSPYSFTLSNLAVGTYTLAARATDNRGAVTTSTSVTVTVGQPNALPTVALTSPSNGATFTAPANLRLVATASDSDGSVDHVDFLRNGVVVATATTAPYVATLTGVAAGTYSLTARATDDRGGVTTSSPVTVTVNALSLTITSPAPNAVVTGESVLVSGTFQGPFGSGVAVNDRAASVDASHHFYALVPIVPGGNTLTATLTAPEGQSLSQSVTVSASGEPSVLEVSADNTVGFAPLAVTYSIRNRSSTDLTFTFDGFGPYDIPGNATVTLSLTYPAGVYSPLIVATDASGATSSQSVVVEVLDETALDLQLRATWSAMNNALIVGDKATAMSYLNAGAQEKYGPVFDTLLPDMPAIIASYSPLQKTTLTPRIAEYAVNRTINGVNRLFLIYFLRDENGLWRVDAM